MKRICKTSLGLLVIGLMLVPMASARTVTIYRIQLGAYPTQTEAQAKKLSAEAEGFSPVYVVEKDGDFPWKVMAGDYTEYRFAKRDCNDLKKTGKNGGSGFVTQVEMSEEEARMDELPIPNAILDSAIEQIASMNLPERTSSRQNAEARVQVGCFSDFKYASSLRCRLMAEGFQPVYIQEKDGQYHIVIGDWSSIEAELDRIRIQEHPLISSATVVPASPDDCLVDVTVLREESEIVECLEKYSSWPGIDAGLHLLHQFPDSASTVRAHYLIGRRMYSIFFSERKSIMEGEKLRNLAELSPLLRSAAEHFEEVISASPDSEYAGQSRYHLGLVHKHMSQYGLKLEELRLAEEVLREADGKGDLTPMQQLNRLSYQFELAKTKRHMLPAVEQRLSDYIASCSDELHRERATAELMLAESLLRRKEFEAARVWLEKLMDEEKSPEARKARFEGMYLLASSYFMHHKQDYGSAAPILEEIASTAQPEDTLVGNAAYYYPRTMALFQLGVCYRKEERFEQAEEVFTQYKAECSGAPLKRKAEQQIRDINLQLGGSR